MFRIEVDRLPPTFNKIWEGIHWAKRKAMRAEWHGLFLAAFQDAKLPKPLPKREGVYRLHCTQFCKGNVRDSDNASIAVKLCKDSLTSYGYIEDDNWKTFNDDMTSTRKGKQNKTVIIIQ